MWEQAGAKQIFVTVEKLFLTATKQSIVAYVFVDQPITVDCVGIWCNPTASHIFACLA